MSFCDMPKSLCSVTKDGVYEVEKKKGILFEITGENT